MALNSSHNRKIGGWGETCAAEYLATKGYELVATNIRTPYGEIDLIARRADVLYFIEVKARTSRSFGLPEEAVNRRKLQHMLLAAEHYAAENSIDHWQLDVISVEGKPGRDPQITHFENVA